MIYVKRGRTKCSFCEQWVTEYFTGNGKTICVSCKKEIAGLMALNSSCAPVATIVRELPLFESMYVWAGLNLLTARLF